MAVWALCVWLPILGTELGHKLSQQFPPTETSQNKALQGLRYKVYRTRFTVQGSMVLYVHVCAL